VNPNVRCTLLKEHLNKLNSKISDIDIVIVEDQMSPNEKSRGVFYCVLYEYSSKCYIIKPHEKNKNLNFGAGLLQKFMVKYSIKYANKMHTHDNFLAYLNNANNSTELDFSKWSKMKMRDIADAFCQAVAWSRMVDDGYINYII
jgi:hypothetical protein